MTFAIPPRDYTANVAKYAWKSYELNWNKAAGWVQNTLYEIFNLTGGIEFACLVGYQTNTDVNAEEIDLVLTIDGRVYTYDASVIGDWTVNEDQMIFLTYTAYNVVPQLWVDAAGQGQPLRTYSTAWAMNGELKGHDMKLEIRDTAAPSANLDVDIRGEYRKLEAV